MDKALRCIAVLFALVATAHGQILRQILQAQPSSSSGVTYTLSHHVNSTNASGSAARVVTLGWTAAIGDAIIVFEDCANTTSTAALPTDNSGGSNSWVLDSSSKATGNAGGWNVTLTGAYVLAITNTFTTVTMNCASAGTNDTAQIFEFTPSGGTPQLDGQAVVNSLTETSGAETGAAVTVSSSTGACAAYMMGGPITSNPASGNAFNVGNDIDAVYGYFGGLAVTHSSGGTYTPVLTVSSQVLGAASTICLK